MKAVSRELLSIVIHDMADRRIKTIASKKLFIAGKNKLTFGESFQPRIYVVTVRSTKRKVFRKLVKM
ncbi:MAG: hypothetical protein IIA45_13280 [Bacteroidetes bacterium]|nr:hypothetical protein [Bacteroidota bacterium]